MARPLLLLERVLMMMKVCDSDNSSEGDGANDDGGDDEGV